MTSSTRRILIGLALGVGTGLFLGEGAEHLRFVADVYLRLLQMTVMPYLILSLIGGIGRLDAAAARQLFVKVGALTVVLWGLALGAVFLMPLAFPAVVSASFFSTTLVEERPPLDFVSLYVPSNPFHSLANNIVPAAVLFSAFLGVALMGIEEKQPLLSILAALEKAVARANRFAVQLTPYGLFAIAARVVGTTDTEQMSRLRVFLVGYGAMSLLLALWVLPGLVACLTPIPARRILQATRDPLITAFMTGELFIVLPTLIDRSKELLEEHGVPEASEGAPPEVIVPAFYSVPHVAKVLSLSFVLFAAWYSDTTLNLGPRAQLAFAGIASLFGSVNAAIPFLLDLARVPADTFQLFVATSVLNSRFGTLAAAMHMVVLALAGTCALAGRLRFSAPRLLRYGLVTAGATAATIFGAGSLLRATGVGAYDKDKVALGMQLLHPPKTKAVVLTELPKEPPTSTRARASVADTVLERGRLRVGYIEGAMPYSFANSEGELVGFDVEMANALAGEMGVGLELAPVTRDRLAEVLDQGLCDVVMSGVALTTTRGSRMVFSAGYLDETLAFVVPDYRRADFSSAEWIRSTPGLRIAVPDIPYLQGLVEREFPGVVALPVPLDVKVGDYLRGRGERVDALALTAERGSFLTLLRPAYSVAVPHPVVLKIPLAYPVARHDVEFARFLSNWIDLKQKDGTIPALYNHWILGQDARPRRPHWSILRDVLRWSR